MGDRAAIVESVVAQLVQEARAAQRELAEAETREQRTAEAAEQARVLARHRRVDLGRVLAKAREQWPARGPRAKGWGEFLADLKIDDSTARRYMELAGHVPEQTEFSLTRGDVSENSARAAAPAIPTYADIGLDNRPRLSLVPAPREEPSVAAVDPSPADPEPDRNTWCTPKYLTDALGRFDLDPCSNERSTVQARQSYRLERGEDGIKLARLTPKTSKVFVNPPFGPGEVIKWVRAYGAHRFVFLVRLDPSTEWFEEIVSRTQLICVPRRDRVQFEPPPGVIASSSPQQHALLYARANDATVAIRKLCYAWRVDAV